MNAAAQGWQRTADVLEDRYGLTAATIDLVHMNADSTDYYVDTYDGPRLYVTEYLRPAVARTARTALGMSQYCRAAGLPVPAVWTDVDGDLVPDAEGSSWAVIDEAPGALATGAMTVALAEHIGGLVGRMHRVLAAYPLPNLSADLSWRTEMVDSLIARCDAVTSRAGREPDEHAMLLRTDLEQRREDLHRHTYALRRLLPPDLASQALHGDLSRLSLFLVDDTVRGITGFLGVHAHLAWELARLAFDPRTVAASPEWISCARAMMLAYHAENPSLRRVEIQAAPRVALLCLLVSFFGAIPAEYGQTKPAEAALRQHWREVQTTIRALLNHLDELDDVFDDPTFETDSR